MTKKLSKLEKIKDQVISWKDHKEHTDRYVANIIYILIGTYNKVTDYNVISHDNVVVEHGFEKLF